MAKSTLLKKYLVVCAKYTRVSRMESVEAKAERNVKRLMFRYLNDLETTAECSAEK